MIKLHDHHLRACLDTWQRSRAAGIGLPDTDDPDYVSLEAVFVHVCHAARGYMVWMCGKLDLPDPDIRPVPEPDRVGEEAIAYLDHLFERWRTPLAGVEPERFGEVHTAGWGTDYSIDSMLEHAVMHPIRHEYQLAELLREAGHR